MKWIVFKTVIITVVLTVSVMVSGALAAIKLGGWVVISGGTYATLKASQAALSQIRDRNQARKQRLAQKTTQKAGRRIATGAIAAGTVGTMAVIAVTTANLVEDHCDELRELTALEAIASGEEPDFEWESCISETRELASSWGSDAIDYGRQQVDALGSYIQKSSSAVGGWLNHSFKQSWDSLREPATWFRGVNWEWPWSSR